MKNELVESIGPFGGVGGGLWDDGIYSTIRQIVIYTSSVIEAIQVEYDDKGESKWSEKHGQNECTKKNIVELDYPNEYLCSIIGHYDLKDKHVVVHSLSFETNRRTYLPFGTKKGNYFKFPSTSGNKIIGFHGRCGRYLDSIGAFIEPIPDASPMKSVGPFGGSTGGYRWDDGSYTNIRKLIVYSSDVIESVKIEYDDEGQPIWSNTHGSKSGKKDTVELDHPYEFLVSVSGYIRVEGTQEVVHSLTLESNRRMYGPFGTEKGSYFKFPSTSGNKITGFHGRCGVNLYSIGGFYESIPDSIRWKSVGPFGRDGGHVWDDGVHTTIRQLIIHSTEVIESIQVEYDETGQSVWSNIHGREMGTRATVELDHPFEFLVSVSGYFEEHFSVVVISSLTFETNKRTYGPFGTENGECFKFPSTSGNKIVGFHGSSCYHLDSIGAYFEPTSDSNQWNTVGPFGGKGGDSWNDEVHTTVRQLIICSSEVIESIQIEYDEKGESKWSNTHGRRKGTINTVELDYPSEFLVSISGYFCEDKSEVVIYSLTIESNKRTYGPFGTEKGQTFKFPSDSGNKIIGFYGRAGCHLNSIGAFYEPFYDSKSWTRVDSFGRHGGCLWDDGTYTTVRKLIVCSSEAGIESIQIEYDENGQSKLSNTHGRKNGTTHTVELDYPNEFLISVSGYIGEFHSLVVIRSLTIESNKRTYGPFGTEKGEYFKVPSTSGKKIIGFYGTSCYLLHSIGAYFEATPDSTN